MFEENSVDRVALDYEGMCTECFDLGHEKMEDDQRMKACSAGLGD